VSQKRVAVGGLAPEIALLKGTRLAVMQEPNQGDVLNAGILKELTSGFDTISARVPYHPEPVKFYPQFKLVVCANYLLEIRSQDHGTWRRIRKVDFLSLFCENPVDNDPNKPYQFKIDLTIDHKFKIWRTVMLALLVDVVLKTDGVVNDCSVVMKASEEYKHQQDVISQFINEHVIQRQGSLLKKTQLNATFTAWHISNMGTKGPKSKEVHDYMDKLYGHQVNGGWMNVCIAMDRFDQPINENEVDDAFSAKSTEEST
jgi:phage/plasmid-associated DNA primase